MARRAEDYLRNATGMPPRPGSRQARRDARRNGATGTSDRRQRQRTYHDNSYDYDPDGPIIPKEYAEDVEFVETKNYSESTIDTFMDTQRESGAYHEDQVSDAEWEEIKERKGTRN